VHNLKCEGSVGQQVPFCKKETALQNECRLRKHGGWKEKDLQREKKGGKGVIVVATWRGGLKWSGHGEKGPRVTGGNGAQRRKKVWGRAITSQT